MDRSCLLAAAKPAISAIAILMANAVPNFGPQHSRAIVGNMAVDVRQRLAVAAGALLPLSDDNSSALPDAVLALMEDPDVRVRHAAANILPVFFEHWEIHE